MEGELTWRLSLNKINNLTSWAILLLIFLSFFLFFVGEFQDKIPREIIDNVFLFEFTIFCGLCGSLSHLLHYSCVNSRESALQHNDCINIIIITPIMTQSIRFMSPIFAIATPQHHCFVCHKGAWLGIFVQVESPYHPPEAPRPCIFTVYSVVSKTTPFFSATSKRRDESRIVGLATRATL